MTQIESLDERRPRGAADILAIGFGTSVVMWAASYFGCLSRLVGNSVPPPLLFVFLLACQVAGGFVVGRYTTRGWRGGLAAGALSGAVNLLALGSLLGGNTPNAIKAWALLWVPGTLAVAMLLSGVGALVGQAFPERPRAERGWSGLLSTVAACATLVLLAAGGVVTGFDEGLAVVDWPNTEGYNMFLYPLVRMTGGIYLEHAHRLLGSLVGLTTLVLAIHAQVTERRGWIKGLAWVALLFVVFQGILGGLRVTGRFTLSTVEADTDPSVVLATVHGIFGQIVFGTLVALAICRSRTWKTAGPPTFAPGASTDRAFGIILVVLLVGQLILGALVRHFTWALQMLRYGLEAGPEKLTKVGQWALHLHITVAVVVVLLTIAVGVRAWGLYRAVPVLPKLGRGLLMLAGVQLALGVAALIVTGDDNPMRRPKALDVGVTTAHQVVGAALLAWALMVLIWGYRLLRTENSTGGVTAEVETSVAL